MTAGILTAVTSKRTVSLFDTFVLFGFFGAFAFFGATGQ